METVVIGNLTLTTNNTLYSLIDYANSTVSSDQGLSTNFSVGSTVGTFGATSVDDVIADSSNETDSLKCNLFGENEDWKCNTLIIVRRVSAALSLIGCLSIICVIWLFRRYQFFSQRLVVYLSISGILVSVGHLMGGMYSDGPTCNFEAFCLTLADWSMLLWIACITYNVLSNAVFLRNIERYEWVYHVIGWSVPFVIAIVPLFGDYYGPAGPWCWIPKQYSNWRIGLWYAPFLGIIFLQVLSTIAIIIATRRRVRKWEGTYSPELERAKQVIKDDVKPLLGYVLIYLITSVIPVITRIQDAEAPDAIPEFALGVLENFLTPFPGFIYAIHFLMERDNRVRLTWNQVKAAWQSNTNLQTVVREYPIMYRMEDKVCKGENQVIQFLRYDHVEYQKLQGAACKSQSCLEE